ncbi:MULTISPECIES: nitrogen fixation protein NifZ [Phytobacter]|jgi:nitrogen fixation protein NifZ|uniref:Nitrogen fixation protein NifZ n=1 Tax=Citrobacter bitternis TaxID=1585982 RepID=A0ABW1PXT4_9ENTR|nr:MULTISPECIES: nitrogen fixation protein NifZ [Phytobacter]MBY6256437.1 nitrogen fixation protein NifZ [Phytobacter diazotrophicus]
MTPIFTFGDEVRVTRAIRNDGTMPGYTRGQLLVRRGSTGFVREWGVFLQDQIIYQIHFLDGDIVVGCRAQELIPAGQPWDAGMLQFGDPVTALQPLSVNGAVVVSAGAMGQIEATDQGHDGNSYTVTFSGRWFQVPASALRLAEEIA